MKRALFCLAPVLLFVGACSQEVPFKPPPSAAAPAPTTTVEPASCAASARANPTADSKLFSVTPIDKPRCSEPGAATVVAKWDVSSLHATDVSIYVSSPAGEKKLWLDGNATGEATTGKWVFENTCFALQDKASGRVVAARLIGAIPCTR